MRHMQIKVELNPKTFYLHNKKLSQHGRQTWHYCVGWGGMSAHQGPFWSTITKKKTVKSMFNWILQQMWERKKNSYTAKLMSAQHRLWKQKEMTPKSIKKTQKYTGWKQNGGICLLAYSTSQAHDYYM